MGIKISSTAWFDFYGLMRKKIFVSQPKSFSVTEIESFQPDELRIELQKN